MDVAADRVSHHRGNWVVCSYLSKKSGVGVTRASWCVAYHTGSGGSILDRAAISLVGVEDLSNGALRRIWHPVLSMPDLVELYMLELSVGGHYFKFKTRRVFF